MTPSFFTIEEILEFHIEQIELYGGSHGIREQALLESAMTMPMAGIGDEYFHEFPFGMAAAYLYHIVQNHPFIDGNKRTGLAACLYFLELHNREIQADPDELYEMVRSVASGKMHKPEITAFLERSCVETNS
ncbi:type II toxin-antitoxin system death-on-curing family toxin [Synergistaceae bacterium OttesenSCG-928-D05]|nr:type II toxin-antitoxin system death-on-curing family toxin [Synergistaceae bacterium OttesenSCG-928-D05]